MNTCTYVQGEAILETAQQLLPEDTDVSGRKGSLQPPHLLHVYRPYKRWLIYFVEATSAMLRALGNVAEMPQLLPTLIRFPFSPTPLLLSSPFSNGVESPTTECPLRGQRACVLPEALWPQGNLGRKVVALAWRWPAAMAAELYRLHVNIVLVLWSMRCCIFNVSLYHYFNAVMFFIYAV